MKHFVALLVVLSASIFMVYSAEEKQKDAVETIQRLGYSCLEERSGRTWGGSVYRCKRNGVVVSIGRFGAGGGGR